MSTAKLGSRNLFPTLRSKAYLNHAAISPPSAAVLKATAALFSNYAEKGLEALPAALDMHEKLKDKLASLISADKAEIGLIQNTTSGVQHIALCLNWNSKDRIILFEGEFPANVTPWLQASASHDLRPVFLSLDSRTDLLERIEGELRKGARLLAISAVQFQTGWLVPLEEIGILCRLYGCLFFVDGIQACGIVPIDVERAQIDFMSCGGHKWLMGLEGQGFLFLRKSRMIDISPRTAGWLSHVDGLKFLFDGPGHLNYQRPIREDAAFVEGGAGNHIGCAALNASVEIILKLDVSAIHEHVNKYIDKIEGPLTEMGFESLRDPMRRSGSLCMKPPPGLDLRDLVKALKEAEIDTSMPDGHFRMAPHWPNSLDEAEVLLGGVRDILHLR